MIRRKYLWHRWFAWHRVKLIDGQNVRFRWLECRYLAAAQGVHYAQWEYRLPRPIP